MRRTPRPRIGRDVVRARAATSPECRTRRRARLLSEGCSRGAPSRMKSSLIVSPLVGCAFDHAPTTALLLSRFGNSASQRRNANGPSLGREFGARRIRIAEPRVDGRGSTCAHNEVRRHAMDPDPRLAAGISPAWLTADVVAGLTVWALIVPESMAYTGVAGVPVQYGLYSVPLAVVAYAILGTSRQLFVGPSSTVAALSAATVAPLVATSGANPVALTAALALVVGVLYVALGFLRMGWVARFFAKPVLDGFIVGLGLFIAVGQLPKLVGVSKPSGNTLHQLLSVIGDVGSWSWVTVAVGACCLAALFILGRFVPRAPAALIVATISIIVAKPLISPTTAYAIVGPGTDRLPIRSVDRRHRFDAGRHGAGRGGNRDRRASRNPSRSQRRTRRSTGTRSTPIRSCSLTALPRSAQALCRVSPLLGACRSPQQPTTRGAKTPLLLGSRFTDGAAHDPVHCGGLRVSARGHALPRSSFSPCQE